MRTRGFRKTYIPGWDEECDYLAKLNQEAHSNEEITETAKRLIEYVDKTRSERWIEAVESIDFTHSSRKAWSTLHRLTGTKPKTKPPPVVKTSDIATAFINNGKFKNKNKTFTRKVNTELREQKTKPSADGYLCQEFAINGMSAALKTMKSGKAPGPDDIHPEFILHLHNSATHWLRLFLGACLTFQAIPKIWRKAKVIGILKPNKPAEQPKSYRPISLLCIPFKLMERLFLNRIKHTVEAYLPHEQAVFREGRSTADQVTLLTEDIEAGFQCKEKRGVVLIDLSAAYDTV